MLCNKIILFFLRPLPLPYDIFTIPSFYLVIFIEIFDFFISCHKFPQELTPKGFEKKTVITLQLVEIFKFMFNFSCSDFSDQAVIGKHLLYRLR